MKHPEPPSGGPLEDGPSQKKQRHNEDNASNIPLANSCGVVDPSPVMVKSLTIANGDDAAAATTIAQAFEKYQAVYLPEYFLDASNNTAKSTKPLQWKDLGGIFESLGSADKESFCIENELAAKALATDGCGDNGDDKTNASSSGSFMKDLSTSDGASPTDRRVGYCSFLIQNDEKVLASVLNKLPVRDPSVSSSLEDSDSETQNQRWDYEPCLWVFFGRNNHSAKDLQGRPEHTDQISHDGTWHYQLSGTKRWLLRPTQQLLRRWNEEKPGNSDATATASNSDEDSEVEPNQLKIDCRTGDVLIVNTRLWRHQTVIPPQGEPSVSYARDFWTQSDRSSSGSGRGESTTGGAMTNVDGLYAMDDIAEDTVIFREDDMPDCKLHRTSEVDKANCKLVELDDGLQAIVSCKFIRAGEFFCIPDSSDEEGDSDDDEGGGWFVDAGDNDNDDFVCRRC